MKIDTVHDTTLGEALQHLTKKDEKKNKMEKQHIGWDHEGNIANEVFFNKELLYKTLSVQKKSTKLSIHAFIISI